MPELKDLKDIKENIVKLTKEGIFSFIRNILMFASIGVLGFLILNLDYTVELFSANPESVIAGILFLLVLIFEIGRLEAVRNNPKNTKKISIIPRRTRRSGKKSAGMRRLSSTGSRSGLLSPMN